MWTLQMHGNTEGLSKDDARSWEERFVERVQSIAAELVPGGHTGVAATFSGDHVGAVNLTDTAAPPEGTPAPDEGDKADGTPEPPPEGPPPTFENGEEHPAEGGEAASGEAPPAPADGGQQ